MFIRIKKLFQIITVCCTLASLPVAAQHRTARTPRPAQSQRAARMRSGEPAARSSRDTAALFHRALSLYNTGQFRGALQAFKALFASQQYLEVSYAYAVQCLMEMEKLHEARLLVERYNRRYPSSAMIPEIYQEILERIHLRDARAASREANENVLTNSITPHRPGRDRKQEGYDEPTQGTVIQRLDEKSTQLAVTGTSNPGRSSSLSNTQSIVSGEGRAGFGVSGKAEAPPKVGEDSGTSPSSIRSSPVAKTLPQTIVVSGRVIAAGNARIQLRGETLFLPVVSIADALGQNISVDTSARTVMARRQSSGVIAEFDAKTGEVRENNSVVVVIPQTAEILFPPSPGDLLLPVEVVAVLLDVSVAINEEKRELQITPNDVANRGSITNSSPARFSPDNLDYAYDFRMADGRYFQTFGLRSSGRLGVWHYTANNSLWGGSGNQAASLRNSSLFLENQSGTRLSFGDFGSGIALRSLSTLLRGAGVETSIGTYRMNFYGGLTISGDTRSPGQLFRQNFDTTVAGVQFSSGEVPGAHNGAEKLEFAVGAQYFNGPAASGETIAASLRQTIARNRLQAELSAGNFLGETLDRQQVRGFGTGIEISDLFAPVRSLLFQASFARYGPSFLTTQKNASFNDRQLWNAGVSWQPSKFMSAGFSIFDSKKISNAEKEARTYSTNVSLNSQNRLLPSLFASYSFTAAGRRGSFAFSQLTLSKNYSKLRLFAALTQPSGKSVVTRLADQTSSAPGTDSVILKQTSLLLNFGVGLDGGKYGSLQASQSFSKTVRTGDFDWYSRQKYWKRIQFAAGLSYFKSASEIKFGGRLISTIALPRNQTLQLHFVKTPSDFQVSVGLAGGLVKPARPLWSLGSFVDRLHASSVRGRVFQDLNANGLYDAGVDVPMQGVAVKLDSAHVTVTHENGEYSFEEIEAGVHSVSLDALTVRADLTVLGPASQIITLNPLRKTIIDFRLIRTGRISGSVWFDANRNGRPDPGEPPLGEVRIVTSSGKDTLTDENGYFIIGDLAPGDYVVFIEERTLPAGFAARIPKLQVRVDAGKETSEIRLPVAERTRESLEKDFSAPKDKNQ